MKFTETALRGAFVVDQEPQRDERGHFSRLWCAREFEAHGLETRVAQCSVSYNRSAGTLRGMHYQVAPFEEAKLVRCIRGAIFDVIIDLRRGSATFTHHVAVVLSAANGTALYVPPGCAHGFQTLEDHSEIVYQISEFYEPAYARGVRWNDPAFNIAWPAATHRIMNDRDAGYPDFDRLVHELPRIGTTGRD
jgi:dTDP-4-dehydrorhamnose 3,5-epimerase